MPVIDVFGGTYLESCQFPNWHRLFGSGGRAAATLAKLGVRARLHTWWPEARREELRRLAVENEFDLAETLSPATQPIRFHYFHGMTVASTTPPRWTLQRAVARAEPRDRVIYFGMLQGDVTVSARQAVFDPQAGIAAKTPESSGLTANQIAIVCNRAEAVALTGRRDPQAAARALLRLPNIVVAIIKADASGALVATGARRVGVACIRTDHVFPIGSGDVFSAAFARFWMGSRRDPVTAARLAAACTASYCSLGHFGGLSARAKAMAPTMPAKKLNPSRKRVYLAAPFFDMPQMWMVGQAFDALKAVGLEPFSPIHHVGRLTTPAATAAKDLAGLRRSDVLYAVINGMDAGTLFEIGYAAARGIPTVLYGQNLHQEDLTMLVGSGAVLESDFATSIYRARWAADV